MASRHWQETIVHWVNCLDVLDTQIHNVAELSDGFFFYCLLQLQTTGIQQKLLPTEINPDLVCETLTTFLKNEFPDYCMESDTSHIQDQVELSYISSLLLYYCSVKSNVSLFTTKMCRKLNEKTQMKVKSFLEVIIQNEECITKSLLKAAIEMTEDLDMSSTKSISPCGLVLSNSPHLYENMVTPKPKHPLRDFLQSPIASQRKLLEKRSKELVKVKSELELERFEKCDLLEELKSTQEKLKCLNEKYNKTLQELKKIRVASFLIDDVPHSSDESKCKSFNEKLLKDNSKDLEKYITTLENDLYILKAEKENLIIKLSCAKNHSAVWQARAEEYMPKCELLEQKYECKEQEMCILVERCRELENHIQEMRKEGDVSIEWDYSDLTAQFTPDNVPAENLAQAVIDVKLQEKEEETRELQQQIKYFQTEGNEMLETISNLKIRLERTVADYDSLKDNCIQLEERILLLTDVQDRLQETQANLNLVNNEMFCLNEKGMSLQHHITELQNLLTCKECLINELSCCTDTLKNDVNDWKSKYSEAKQSLQTKIEQYGVIQMKLQISLNQTEVVEKLNSEVNQSLDAVDSQLGKSVQQLKGFISPYLDDTVINDPIPIITIESENKSVCASVENKVRELGTLLGKLEVQREQTIAKHLNLETTCRHLNENILELCVNIQDLEEKEKVNLLIKSNLEECLQRADKNIDILQHTINEYSQRIEGLSGIIEEKKILIKKLEDVQKNLSDKDSKLSVLEDQGKHVKHKLHKALQELANVQNEKESLIKCITTMTEDNKIEIERLSGLVQTLQISIKDLESEHDQISLQFQDTQRELLNVTENRDALLVKYKCLSQEKDDCIISFNTKIDIFENKVSILENAQKESVLELENTKAELQALSTSKEELCDQYSSLQSKTKERIDLHEGELVLLEKQVVDLTIEKKITCDELQQVKDHILEIQQDRDNLIKMCTKLEEDNLTNMTRLSQEINTLQTELEARENEKILMTNELDSVKSNLLSISQSKDTMFTTHKENMHNYGGQIDKLNNQISSLQATVLTLEKESANAIEELKSVRLKFEDTCENKEAVLKDLESKINTKEEIINNLQSELNTMDLDKTAVNLELKNLTDKLSEVVTHNEIVTVSYRKQLAENEANINTLTNKVIALQSCIQQLEEDKNVVEFNIQSVTANLLEVKKNSEHLLEVNHKLKADKDADIILKEDEVKKLVQERDAIDKELKITKSKLIEIQQSQESFIKSHAQHIEQNSKHVAELMETLETMENDRKHFERENMFVYEDLRNVKCELDALKMSKETLEQVKRGQEESLAANVEEIHTKEKKIDILTNEIIALKDNVEELKMERCGVNNELQSTLVRVVHLESNNENCLQTCKTIKDESERTISQMKYSLEERINALENDKISIAIELEVTKSELFSTKDNETTLLDTYTKDIQDKEDSIKILLNKCANLESEIEILNEEKKAIKCDLEVVRLELIDINSNIEVNRNATVQQQIEEENSTLKIKVEEAEFKIYSENILSTKVENLLALQRSSVQNLIRRMDELVAEKDGISRVCNDLTVNVLSLRTSIENVVGEQEPSRLTDQERTIWQVDLCEEPHELLVLYDYNDKLGSKIVEKDLNSSSSEISLVSSTMFNDENATLELQAIVSAGIAQSSCVKHPLDSKVVVDEIKSTNAMDILGGLNTELRFVKDEMYKMFTLNKTLKVKVLNANKHINELDEKCAFLTKQNEIIATENNELKSSVHDFDQIKIALETSKNNDAMRLQEQLEVQNQVLSETCEKLKLSVKNLEWQRKVESSKGCTIKVELDTFKQQNKLLSEKLQQSEILQLKCEEEYWKLIKSRQETDIKLEGLLGEKKELEHQIFDLHCMGKCLEKKYNNLFSDLSPTNKLVSLKIKFDTAILHLEEEYSKLSGEMLMIILSCLKWTEKRIEDQCFLMGIDWKFKLAAESNDDVTHSSNFVKCDLIDYKTIMEVQVPSVQCQIDSMSTELESFRACYSELKAECEAVALFSKSQQTTELISEWNPNKTISGLNLKERAELLRVLLTYGIHGAVAMQKPVNLDYNDSLECTNLFQESPPSKDIHNGHEFTELQKQVLDLMEQNKSLTLSLQVSEKAKYELHKKVNAMKVLNKSIVVEKESALIQKHALEERIMAMEVEQNNVKLNTKKIAINENNYRDEYRKLKEEHNVLLLNYSDIKAKFNEKEWSKEKHKLQLQYQTELEKQVSDIRAHYEDKLEKLKSKMKSMYNDELAKVKYQYEENCEQKDVKKYIEKLAKCHVDINELRSQVWELSERLLKEQSEKAQLEQQLTHQHTRHRASNDIKAKRETSSKHKGTDDQRNLQARDVMDVIDESITYVRRRSIRKSVPSGMGEAFPTEDEEGEVFNTTYLADLKAGLCQPQGRGNKERISQLQYRNSLCPPHLKSSYPAETQFHDPQEFNEDDLKLGYAVDVDHYDSLSTSCLIPSEKQRKKDRGQTSYKKPGPPTPGKNGGRLSLQVNSLSKSHRRSAIRSVEPTIGHLSTACGGSSGLCESDEGLKSQGATWWRRDRDEKGSELGTTPRSILREQNDMSGSRKGATPSRLRSLFSSKNSRRDENTPVTPRSRKLTFFRKSSRNHPW